MSEGSKTPVTKSMVTFVALVAAALGAFLLLFFWNGNPYVVQIVSIIGDTFWVFCLVSFDSSLGPGYNLNSEEFKQELPRALWVHCGFLVLLTAIETIALWAEPHLPNYWRVEDSIRSMSLFDYVLMFVGAGICATEILVVRKLLSRVVRAPDPSTFTS